jgi:glutathione reductase (NADPH)
MLAENYDVVILGGGNAGMGVTVPTRAVGLSAAMVEAWVLDGTCPNRGCTPRRCSLRQDARCTRSNGEHS